MSLLILSYRRVRRPAPVRDNYRQSRQNTYLWPVCGKWIPPVLFATDSAAYLTGVNFGKHKLAPRVSPNKSIEGFVGGILGAVLITVLFMLVDSTVALPYGIYRMSLFAAFFSVAGQFGDLIESAMKRHFGVKDSGKFIPGHGGVLDRFDSMLVVFPMMHLFGLF